MSALGEAAARLNLPAFPCNAEKRPITARGLYDATTSQAEILRMFSSASAIMIGVPTGAVSGIVGIDVDIKNGARGTEWLEANAHRLPPTRTHRTRSGGLHLIFLAPDQPIRNSVSVIAPGVDVRGDGGYVVFPPSPGYAIADDTPPAEMPDWLIAECLKKPPRPEPTYTPPKASNIQGGTPYGRRALDGECHAIRNAGEGQKHHTLNRAAYSIGGLVACGELDEGEALGQLRAALYDIRDRCDDFRHAEQTLETAFADGKAAPRSKPVDTRPTFDAGHTVRIKQHFDPETGELIEPPKAAAAPAKEDPGALPLLDPTQWTTPPPPRRWIVDGWIPVGVVSAKYGDGGIGKTLSAQQLMTSVSIGGEWLGMQTSEGRTLGIFCEDDNDELHRRQIAINKAYGIHMRDLAQMRLLSRLGEDNSLVHYDNTGSYLTAFHARVMEACKDWRPDLVVLDTAADLYPDNENDRSKVRWFIQAGLARIARDFACAVLLLAHPSASGLSSGSGTGGSTAWNNTVRSRIYLAKEEGEEADPNVRIMSKKKSNYGAQGGDIRLAWEDGVLAPVGKSNSGSPVPWETIREIFDEIERAWRSERPWSNAWQTKAAGRFLPTWVKFKFGINEKVATKMLADWQATGCLSTEIHNSHTKATGLKVLRRPDR